MERYFLYNPYNTLYYTYIILLYILFYIFIVFFVPLVPFVPLYINKYVIMYVLYINIGFWEFLSSFLAGTRPGTTTAAARSTVPLWPLTAMPGGVPQAPGCSTSVLVPPFVVPPGTQKARKAAALRASII
jgi:hypothetical protein